MALTIDGIRIPHQVQSEGPQAVEAYVRELKRLVDMPHPLPKRAPNETRAQQLQRYESHLEVIAEHQRDTEALEAKAARGQPITAADVTSAAPGQDPQGDGPHDGAADPFAHD